MKPSKDSFLNHYVSEWNDDGFMRAKFRGIFSRQDESWDTHFNFWSNLIIRTAIHYGETTCSAAEVTSSWFKRNGVNPLCLNSILAEMIRQGQLKSMASVLKPNSFLFSSILSSIAWMSPWLFRSTELGNEKVNGTFVVMEALKAKADMVVEQASKVGLCVSESILTEATLVQLSGSHLEASLVRSQLISEGRASPIAFKSSSGTLIQGLKLRNGILPSPSSLDNDKLILRLKHESESLQAKVQILMESRNKAGATELQNRRVALHQIPSRHARGVKRLDSTIDTCLAYLDKIDCILAVLAEAQTSKQVVEAMKAGADAIKSCAMHVEEVEECVKNVEEAFKLQSDSQQALGMAVSHSVEDEVLESELGKLLGFNDDGGDAMIRREGELKVGPVSSGPNFSHKLVTGIKRKQNLLA